MIITGPEIKEQIEQRHIDIDPFDESCINPASIDLTLGSTVSVYNAWVSTGYEFEHAPSHFDGSYIQRTLNVIDIKKQADLQTFKIHEDLGWVLKPDILYLMHTRERVHTKRYVPVLDGKSSIGRLGIVIHLTAGYGDPGFDGQYTLEVTVVHAIRIYAGMRFCQMRFHTCAGDLLDYQDTGHYKGLAAQGPVASQAYKQFSV